MSCEPLAEKIGPSQERTAHSLWLLLAEDDKLFSSLFERFWKQLQPDVEVVTVPSIRSALSVLAVRDTQPSVAVLDFNLEDGTAHQILEKLRCPTVVWSASAGPKLVRKPQGRADLVREVEKIAVLGGLDVPSQ